jgi:ribA/ribD-fused uncharacterized protein
MIGMSSMEVISKFKNEYDFLSNYYFLPMLIKWEGMLWATVEHAYQAAKTLDPIARKEIKNAETPNIAKRLGNTVKLRDDWDKIRISIMTELVWLKFESNPYLQDKLLDTGNAYIVEGNYWHDNFWGECYCDKCAHIAGTNYLGQILMNIRKEIANPMTKEQKLREAVFLYIEAKKRLTLCMQDHFRQVCHPCKEYSKCLVYDGYVSAWMNLQKSYYKEKE